MGLNEDLATLRRHWNEVDGVAELRAHVVELREALAAKDARIAALEAEIADGWRVSLALAYSGAKLYTDDGELSDGSASPAIDFRRDSYAEIKAKIQQRGLNWLNEHREEAEAIMSAPQQIAALEAKCERMAKCIEAAGRTIVAADGPGVIRDREQAAELANRHSEYLAARAVVEEGES